MFNRLSNGATILATLMMGLMAGFFFSFSIVVMPGLDLAAPAAAIDAMQSINRAVRNPMFAVAFAGPLLIGLLAAVAHFYRGQTINALLLTVAMVCYALGVLWLTSSINVPMNDALAGLASTTTGAPAVWSEFSGRWTAANHWRTASTALATLLCALAIRSR